jgi:hypothetical protein
MLGFCAPAAGSPPDDATPEPFRSLQIATTAAAATTKKKRRPAGTPGNNHCPSNWLHAW